MPVSSTKYFLTGVGWEAPDAQGTEILALCAEIKGLKNRKHPSNKEKTPKRERKEKRDRGKDRVTSKAKEKRDYIWYIIAPKVKEPTALIKYSKTYNWCSIENGAPKGKGCDKWVYHEQSKCRRWSNNKNTKRGASSDTPSKKGGLHTLQVKKACVTLK